MPSLANYANRSLNCSQKLSAQSTSTRRSSALTDYWHLKRVSLLLVCRSNWNRKLNVDLISTARCGRPNHLVYHVRRPRQSQSAAQVCGRWKHANSRCFFIINWKHGKPSAESANYSTGGAWVAYVKQNVNWCNRSIFSLIGLFFRMRRLAIEVGYYYDFWWLLQPGHNQQVTDQRDPKKKIQTKCQPSKEAAKKRPNLYQTNDEREPVRQLPPFWVTRSLLLSLLLLNQVARKGRPKNLLLSDPPALWFPFRRACDHRHSVDWRSRSKRPQPPHLNFPDDSSSDWNLFPVAIDFCSPLAVRVVQTVQPVDLSGCWLLVRQAWRVDVTAGTEAADENGRWRLPDQANGYVSLSAALFDYFMLGHERERLFIRPDGWTRR